MSRKKDFNNFIVDKMSREMKEAADNLIGVCITSKAVLGMEPDEVIGMFVKIVNESIGKIDFEKATKEIKELSDVTVSIVEMLDKIAEMEK